MAVDVEKLIISLEANTELLRRQLDQAQRTTNRSLTGIERRFARFDRGLRRLMRRLGPLIGATLGAAGAKAIAGFVKGVIEAGDRLDETARKLGIGVEALQEFRFAAAQAGIAQTTFDMALQRFVRRTAEAARGTGEAREALQQLGIRSTDTGGRLRPVEVLLGDVADALARIPDQGERVRLAFKLFDSEGVTLVNVLSRGSAQLQAWREEARRTGAVIRENLVRRASELNDRLTALGAMLQGRLATAVLENSAAIETFASAMAQAIPVIVRFSTEVARFLASFADDRPIEEVLGLDVAELEDRASRLRAKLDRLRTLQGLTAADRLDLLFKGRDEAIRRHLAELQQVLTKLDAATRRINGPRIAPDAGIASRPAATAGAPPSRPPSADPFAIAGPTTLFPSETIAAPTDAIQVFSLARQALEAAADPLERYNTAVAQLGKLLQMSKINQEEYNAALDAAARLFDPARQKAEELSTQFAAMFESRGIDALLSGRLGAAIRGLARDLAQLVLRIAILQPLAESIAQPLGIGLANLFGLGRATGGAVAPGHIFPVGERGPEAIVGRGLFIPAAPARVLSAAQTREASHAAATVAVTINAPGADEGTLARLKGLVAAEVVPQAVAAATAGTMSRLTRPRFAF